VKESRQQLEDGVNTLSPQPRGGSRPGPSTPLRSGVANAHTRRAVRRWFHGDRILAVDLSVAEEWGRQNVPDPMPVIDGLLAATAKVHGLTLATRNVKDVARAGADLVNPFEP